VGRKNARLSNIYRVNQTQEIGCSEIEILIAAVKTEKQRTFVAECRAYLENIVKSEGHSDRSPAQYCGLNWHYVHAKRSKFKYEMFQLFQEKIEAIASLLNSRSFSFSYNAVDLFRWFFEHLVI
jgi:hypothetical protein